MIVKRLLPVKRMFLCIKKQFGTLFDMWRKKGPAIYLNLLSIIDTELAGYYNLNLNYRTISHFLPITSKEYIDIDKFEQDFKQLKSVIPDGKKEGDTPLISIILPVYNVENYIVRCLDSIRNQTYINWEAILVDDGSTDMSGKICDQYKEIDERFIVCHQNNSGVAMARRRGLELANGNYITFVDPDDYIYPDYITYLLDLCLDNSVKISCCDYRSSELKKLTKDKEVTVGSQVMSKTDFLNKMLYQRKMDCFLWGKMFESTLLKKVNIPNVYLCEDLPAMCHAVSLCDTDIAISVRKLYFYNKRQTGLTREEFNSKALCMLDVADNMEKNISRLYPQCYKSALCRKFSAYFHIYLALPPDKLSYKEEKNRIEKFIIQSRTRIIFDRNARKKAKLGAVLSFFGFNTIRGVLKILK